MPIFEVMIIVAILLAGAAVYFFRQWGKDMDRANKHSAQVKRHRINLLKGKDNESKN